MYSLILSDTAWKSSTLSRLSKIEILFTELSAANKKSKKGRQAKWKKFHGRKYRRNISRAGDACYIHFYAAHLGGMFENATNK